MTKFKVGRSYECRSIGDHNCIFSVTVLRRTPKMVTFRTMHGERRCRVKEYNGSERAFAMGNYSMCPVFDADREKV